MSETDKTAPYQWSQIEQEIENMKQVDGGFSQAQRGLVMLPNGQELFVKLGTQDNTRKWAKKEIGVYRILAKHDYTHIPHLVAVNSDETGFALEAFTPMDGWNWQADWSTERLAATLRAMSDLTDIELSGDERTYFAEKNISQDDNGWNPLHVSLDKQTLLIHKLHEMGAEDIAAGIDFEDDAGKSNEYVFASDTLVHYDIRADNCAWNPNINQVKIVDWNWTQLGDKDIELAATLTHIQKSGFDLPTDVLAQLKPAALHWMAGFWLNAATTPIWENGPEHLRDFQLLTGVTALRLIRQLT